MSQEFGYEIRWTAEYLELFKLLAAPYIALMRIVLSVEYTFCILVYALYSYKLIATTLHMEFI